jgi:hypothetical protein
MKPPTVRWLGLVSLMAAGLASEARAGDPAPASSVAPPPAASSSSAAPADGTVVDAKQLNGVVVKGKRDIFAESDARMKKLKESLPDLNSDAGHKESLAQRIVDSTGHYLTSRQDPNKLSDAEKKTVQHIQSATSVDRNHDAGRPPVSQPDAKDYADPLCQTGSCPP